MAESGAAGFPGGCFVFGYFRTVLERFRTVLDRFRTVFVHSFVFFVVMKSFSKKNEKNIFLIQNYFEFFQKKSQVSGRLFRFRFQSARDSALALGAGLVRGSSGWVLQEIVTTPTHTLKVLKVSKSFLEVSKSFL